MGVGVGAGAGSILVSTLPQPQPSILRPPLAASCSLSHRLRACVEGRGCVELRICKKRTN